MSQSEPTPPIIPMPAHGSPRHGGGSSPPHWQLSKEDWDKHREKTEDLERWVWGDKDREIAGAEKRLVKVEKFIVFVMGIAAAIGAVGGYLVSWVRGEK